MRHDLIYVISLFFPCAPAVMMYNIQLGTSTSVKARESGRVGSHYFGNHMHPPRTRLALLPPAFAPLSFPSLLLLLHLAKQGEGVILTCISTNKPNSGCTENKHASSIHRIGTNRARE